MIVFHFNYKEIYFFLYTYISIKSINKILCMNYKKTQKNIKISLNKLTYQQDLRFKSL
jgi:hypothetical protein